MPGIPGTFVSIEETGHFEVRSETGDLKALNRPFFGAPGRGRGSGPQAFMVESPAGRIGAAHFHDVDQFQVFFASAGATYKHSPIESPLLHYADAYTTYGPYAAGPREPLTFLTLRARHSGVTAYVPEERGKLPRATRPRRHSVVDLGAAEPPSQRLHTTALIGPYEDGLAAYVIEAGPDTVAQLPTVGRCGGQYTIVLDGSVIHGGRDLECRAVRWDDAADDAPPLTAGGSGLRVLILRFPDPPSAEGAQR